MTETDLSSLEKKVYIGRLLGYYGALLSDRQRQTMSLYYDDDLSLGEISALTEITRQGVYESIKKSEALLIGYEAKLGFAERFDGAAEASEELSILIKKLCPQVAHELESAAEKLKNALGRGDI